MLDSYPPDLNGGAYFTHRLAVSLKKEGLNRHPVVYKLQDYYGEFISGTFYGPELQRVEPVYRIEKIIKRRGNKALVKWIGYTTPTWEPQSAVL